MIRLTTLALTGILAAAAVHAQEPASPPPEAVGGALRAATSQRNRAFDEVIELAAQMAVKNRQIDDMRKEIETLKAKPAPAPAELAK